MKHNTGRIIQIRANKVQNNNEILRKKFILLKTKFKLQTTSHKFFINYKICVKLENTQYTIFFKWNKNKN